MIKLTTADLDRIESMASPISNETFAALIALARAGIAAEAKPTDISTRLREYAGTPGYSHGDYADTMRAAADEIERYYGGMCAWKKTAEAKDAKFVKSRAAEAPADAEITALHRDIMNMALPRRRELITLQGQGEMAYKFGHRDARHAAAEIVTAWGAHRAATKGTA